MPPQEVIADSTANKIKHLVVFDFDHSLLEEDSDTFSVLNLNPEIREQMNSLKDVMQWTDMMDHVYGKLHTSGITEEQIRTALAKAPMHPSTIRALHLANRNGADLMVLSDANTFFIECILEANNIKHLFKGIIANPGQFEDGRLRIRRYYPDHFIHGCQHPCTVNICKGLELTKILQDRQHYHKVVYIGDGANDFCPIAKLTSCDYALPRKDFALEKVITQRHPALVKLEASLMPWSTGDDLFRIFSHVFSNM